MVYVKYAGMCKFSRRYSQGILLKNACSLSQTGNISILALIGPVKAALLALSADFTESSLNLSNISTRVLAN